jgi:PAS domain S-box-containing protein
MFASACQPTFWSPHVTLFVALAGNLNRQRASQAAGFAAMTIAAAAFISWWVSLPLLSNWGSGFATVKPTTALSLAALGLAVVYPGTASRFAFAIGLAVAAIAALDLLDLFGIDFGINRLNSLLAPRAAVPGHETSFRMINGVPVALELAGASVALGCFERYRFAATALSGIAGSMAIFALFNYLNGVHTLSIETPTPLTAIGLLCVAGAIILRVGTMPALRKPWPLWHLQIMLGCAIIAPLLLFGVYTGIRITDAQLRDVQNNLMSEARTLSAGVDRQIIGEVERLQALAASPSLRQGDFAEFQHQAEASLALLQIGNIVLINRNMQQLVNTFVPFGKPLPKAVVPKPIERAFATGKPQVTGLFMAPVVDQFMFGILVPVQIDGENRYVLGRSQDQHALARLVAANELPRGWLAVVADAAHRIIVRSDQQGVFMGRELPSAQWHREGPDGEFEFIDSEGRPSMEAYARSELTGWESAVWVPTALLEAPVRTLWWTIVLTGVLAFMLVVGLASWLGRIIARSVDDAARAAIALGEGVSLPLSGSPVAEVDTLMGELQRTAARRRAAEDLVRQSESIFRAMFEVSSVGKMEVEPGTGRILRANAAMCKFVGYSEAELLARTVLDITHPDDRDYIRESCRRLDAGESAVFDVEKRYVRKDESAVWARTTVNVIRDESGRPLRNTAVVLDFTERKEREEKEHLLMREVNHRAKNMLSVVDAIAHQTVTRNPEDFIERFSERIQALSANQDLLVRNEWHGVEIADLVRAQLAHFADLIGSRIAAHGPRLRLMPASAQAIGLALHELATNAGKYGALSTDTGRLDICWGIEGDTFAMSWTEREGPPVSPPERRGFGTIVMEAMAERSVDGAVDLEYPPSGLTWRLICPAANALEPGHREKISGNGENRTDGATGKGKVRTRA